VEAEVLGQDTEELADDVWAVGLVGVVKWIHCGCLMAKCRMELRAYKTAVSIRNPLLRASSLNRFHMFSDFPIISMAVFGSWLGSKDCGASDSWKDYFGTF